VVIYRFAKSSNWKKEFEALQKQLSLAAVIRDSSGVSLGSFTATAGGGSTGRRVPIWRCPASGIVPKEVCLAVGSAFAANPSAYYRFTPVIYTTAKREFELGIEKTTQRQRLAVFGALTWTMADRTLNAGEIVAMRVRWVGSPATLYSPFFSVEFER
jgi:hypothetical protein